MPKYLDSTGKYVIAIWPTRYCTVKYTEYGSGSDGGTGEFLSDRQLEVGGLKITSQIEN